MEIVEFEKAQVIPPKRLFAMAGAMGRSYIEYKGMSRENAERLVAYRLLEMCYIDKQVAVEVARTSIRWCELGFPCVEVAHRLAASLIATSMPPEITDDLVKMPWSCFCFTAPAGLVADYEITALALREPHGYSMISYLPLGGLFHLGFETDLSSWADDLNPKFNAESKIEIDSTIPRQVRTLGKLFVGTCAEISTYRPSIYARASDAKRKLPHWSKRKLDVFKLTRPVEVDVRGFVKDYVTKGLRLPTVQSLVRGHWKQQPCGSGRSERKFIHIEPYWRGPEDAPVAVRPHIIGTE